MAQQKAGDYVQTINPEGYINNREITNLPGIYLVKGSRDCVIENKEKVVSRKGYELLGSAKSKNKGYYGSYDWETSNKVTRSVRMNDDGELEVWFSQGWRTIKTYADLTRLDFTPWYSSTELQDLLLFVNGGDGIDMWSGGCALLQSFTTNSLTLQGSMSSKTTIAFVEGGTSDDTITDSASGFVNAGFAVGDKITIAGSASNDGTYTIKSVTAGIITIASSEDLANEAAGASVTITRPGATWAESGFLTAGTRKVVIDGTEYAYTGGESTDTLTGLSGLSGFSAGDVIVQAVRSATPAPLNNLELDIISVINNYVIVGSTKHRVVFGSANTDYTSISGATTPLRIAGEGFEVVLDSTPTAFVPGAVEDELFIAGRKNDWYKITFELSADQGDEQIRVKKLPTATGQAARSQGSVVRIKNGVAFLNFEPTIDTLTRLLDINTPTSKPISDDIKDDILSYDLTNAHGLFYQNQIFFLFPAEGIVQIYDLEHQLWQPPHYLPLGRLALIDVNEDGTQVLCGHSAVSNETYKLYTGYDDNGAPLRVEMHFGYDNFGSRFMHKNADEFATELYMSENTNVTNRVVYDYKGATATREFEIRGDDTTIKFTPDLSGGFGYEKLGSNPLGSLGTSVDDLSKYRCVDTTSDLDFFERQRVYIGEGVGIRFAVIAYGENVELSENIPTHIIR